METVAIVVDCRTRELEVFSASVTQAANGGIVLRKAAGLGTLSDMKEGDYIPYTIMFLGKYSAQSSEGFVEVFTPQNHHTRFLEGGAGLGWLSAGCRKGDCLRPVTDRRGEKFSLTVVEGGCVMTKVTTHTNSNKETAHAALLGLRLRSEMTGELVLVEGQSDTTQGWTFRFNRKQNGLRTSFPAEHRQDVFDGKKKEKEKIEAPEQDKPAKRVRPSGM